MPPGRPVADVRLAGEGVLGEPVGVGGAAGVGDLRGERPDDLGLVTAQGRVERDEPE